MHKRVKIKSGKKLASAVLVTIALIASFAITTYAYTLTYIGIYDNLFVTGNVRINLNDGEPIIGEDEYLFEPGMTVVKRFFLQNESSFSVYYRIYFEDIQGALADVIEVKLTSGDAVLFEGKLSDMTRENMDAAEDSLRIGEAHWFEIQFHYPEGEGNETQAKDLTFRISAEAVQTKNNPDREFD